MNLKYIYNKWKNSYTTEYIQWDSIYIKYSMVRKNQESCFPWGSGGGLYWEWS